MHNADAGTTPGACKRNRDVAWDGFDTGGYVADNYARIHEFDRRIITSLSSYYRRLRPGSLSSALDIGTGPNLYPLMLVAAASRRVEALDRSAANVAYLRRAVGEGAPASWAVLGPLPNPQQGPSGQTR